MIEINLAQTPGWQLALYGLLLVLPILPNLWSIWHASTREFNPPHEKLVWIGVAVFFPLLGGLAYLFYGIRRGRKPTPPTDAPSDTEA